MDQILTLKKLVAHKRLSFYIIEKKQSHLQRDIFSLISEKDPLLFFYFVFI